jgi:hypothetical protein
MVEEPAREVNFPDCPVRVAVGPVEQDVRCDILTVQRRRIRDGWNERGIRVGM